MWASLSSYPDSQFPAFNVIILKFITLFNQIHMHPHHLHMVHLNKILPDSLRFSKFSLLKTLNQYDHSEYTKYEIPPQKKILPAVPFWTSLRQVHYTTRTTCMIKIVHYLSLMINAIVLKQWIQTPSSHIYYPQA
jgi:hypothetical protein